MISTIVDALIIRLCNSNVWAELSIVSIKSKHIEPEARASLLLVSNRCETVKAMSPLGETVSSTP